MVVGLDKPPFAIYRVNSSLAQADVFSHVFLGSFRRFKSSAGLHFTLAMFHTMKFHHPIAGLALVQGPQVPWTR